MTNQVTDAERQKRNSTLLFRYSLFWSVCLLAAVPIAAIYSGETADIFRDFIYIITSPSKLVTDYFNLGGLASALLNAALCGLSCNLIVKISGAEMKSVVLAGYFLVIAHCFYGLNFINMWPPFCGVFVYCAVTKKRFSENVHIAMFSTSLGPFISDFLFRYTLGDSFVFGQPKVTVIGAILALAFGILAGFVVPALLPGTTKMHRGFNLYKAGLAIGLLGLFVYSFMYKTLGIEPPDALYRENPLYDLNECSYGEFMNVFFLFIFVCSIAIGFFMNGKSFKGYSTLMKTTGHSIDFADTFGAPLSFINIGVYGIFIILYLNLIFLFPSGAGYTGPTAGITIAALTFSTAGQHPRNVWPVVAGYLSLYLISLCISAVAGLDMTWNLSSQGYINGLAFSTGLCPFSGKYGWKIGIVAGLVSATICTSTSAIHGGFVLYNGGLTAGLTALIMIPFLDYYKIKEKHSDDFLEAPNA